MQKSREKIIKQKEEYICCDKCGKEIYKDGFTHHVYFRGKGISGVDYVQGENSFDCCDNCCHELMDRYFKKSK